jgi:DNA-binding CsgD family transcriptional regulator
LRNPRIAELTHALSVWAPGDPPAVSWLTTELIDLLGAQFVGAYRARATERGWSLDFMCGAGEDAAAQIRAFRRYVGRLPASDLFIAYSPSFVPTAQRNRVVTLRDLGRLFDARVCDAINQSLLPAVGAAGHDQLRVLVCDGPRLLSWVGATRPERFTEREAALIQPLIKPLRERLQLERLLDAPWLRAGALDAVLEALARPAFLASRHGAIEVANRAGIALLERDTAGVLASIRESKRLGSRGGEFTIQELSSPGSPPYVLAIQNEKAPTPGDRAAVAQRHWRLTLRQTEVLESLATGAANKEIARRLECAESTVENHVTQLYRRSGAKSRVDLVARLFALPSS